MAMPKADYSKYVGQQFNNWTVLEIGEYNGGLTKALCRCECGEERMVFIMALKSGASKSCGCSKVIYKEKDYIGKKIKEWLLLGPMKKENRQIYMWARCSCGTEKYVNLRSLLKGETRSCGCLRSEENRVRQTTHGLSKHKLYQTWINMNLRCYDEKTDSYKYYGARGISVCDEWKNDPEAFINWGINNGWKENLRIDRINNDGNYEPSNCRFITNQENVFNQRKLSASNTSGYLGVFLRKDSGKYNATIRYNDKKILDKSTFKTAEDAAIARDIFIIKNNLPHPLNFPELKYNSPI